MPFAVQKKQMDWQKEAKESIGQEMEKTIQIFTDFSIKKGEKRASCAIIIHCYTPQLKPIEKYSLDYSMAVLGDRDFFFVLPESLDEAYYVANFKKASIVRFDDKYFTSREGYSQLYMSPMLYQRFASTHEFILILQTDAIVFKDELDYWCSQPWDYIGAPWPNEMPGRPGGSRIQLVLDRDCFSGSDRQR